MADKNPEEYKNPSKGDYVKENQEKIRRPLINPDNHKKKIEKSNLKLFQYTIPLSTPQSTNPSYSVPSLPSFLELEAMIEAHKIREVFCIENFITHLADQLEAARRLSHGRITRERRELSDRIMNAQANYKGMTGRYFNPKSTES